MHGYIKHYINFKEIIQHLQINSNGEFNKIKL